MNGGIGGLFACNLVLQSHDIFLGLSYPGVGAGDLGLKFRHLQNCKSLTLPHPVTDIDVNVPDVAGYFAVDVDLLKWLKYPGDGELVSNEARLRGRSRNRRRRS